MTYPNPHQQQVIDHLHGPLLVLAYDTPAFAV